MSPMKVGLFACLMTAMSAQASVIPLPTATGGSIADASTSTFSFNIAADYKISDLNIQLALSHSWVGDLTIILTGPDGITSVTLLDQPGAPSPSAFGYNANLSADTPIVFDDEGTVAAETMGSQCGSTDLVIGVDCNAGESFIPTELLSLFDGMSTKGEWILSITDAATGDTGSLRSFNFIVSTDDVVTVPEPASLALLGLGLVGLLATRRKPSV